MSIYYPPKGAWKLKDSINRESGQKTKDPPKNIGAVFRRGAEAELNIVDFLGERAIAKNRVVKGYRIREIDEKLRAERTRKEAKLLSDIKNINIHCPYIYFVDVTNGLLVMEFIDGPRLKDLLETIIKSPSNEDIKINNIKNILIRLGSEIGKLHSGNITHGDLTTSNMLLYQKDADTILDTISSNGIIDMKDVKIYFIDLSLGEKDANIEKLGEDLDVFFKAYESTHPTLLHLTDSFWIGYRKEKSEYGQVQNRLKEIKKRARYR